MEEKERRKKERFIDTFFPDKGPLRRELYPRHIEFMDAGAHYRQRAFIAANRVGKSLTAAIEVSFHLTGQYPHWWKGHRFNRPISAWAAAQTNEFLKSSVQENLFGANREEFGSGLIPKAALLDVNGQFNVTNMPGVPGCVGTALVRHVSGGWSKIEFKTYAQGWQTFEGAKRDLVWLDEDPGDGKIFTSSMTRTLSTTGRPEDNGLIICTFTPLLGISDVVLSFLPEGEIPVDGIHPDGNKFVVRCGWDDVPHLDERSKREMMLSYEEHEKDARTKGLPYLGKGAVFPYPLDMYVVDPIKIPDWWPRCYGMDVGWQYTTAVFLAIDPETNGVIAYHEYEGRTQPPVVHAAAIKAIAGNWMVGAIDPRGATQGSQIDGTQFATLYRQEGLRLVFADNSVEASIGQIQQMIMTGTFKISSACQRLIGELKIYCRDDSGKIKKNQKDHLIDALRYGIRTGIQHAELPSAASREEFSAMYARLAKSGEGRNPVTGY